MKKYIRWFHEITADEVGLVGGKGANLGEMTGADFPVPPGFCVTAPAYQELIAASGLYPHIQEIIDQMDMENPNDVAEKTAGIRELIIQQPIPAHMQDEILESYVHLNRLLDLPAELSPAVAIRSSATAEDLPTASFAGQQDTYLNIRGEAALLDHIRQCWASMWTSRAVTYRRKKGFDHHKVYVAVVVQAMIEAQISGILFTANPVTGREDEVVINASWGLGEAIVSGLVSPDTVTVKKECGTILDRHTAIKEKMIVYREQGGTEELLVPEELSRAKTLTRAQVADLTALGAKVEQHYGVPQDIEWGFDRGKWYLLQARPITTLSPEASATTVPGEFSRVMLAEIFPDALSPAFLSVVLPLFAGMFDFTFRTLGFEPAQDMEAVRAFYHQPYFSKAYIEQSLARLSPEVRETMVTQFINPISHEKIKSKRELSPAYLGMLARMVRFMIQFPNKLPNILSQYQAEIRQISELDLNSATEGEIIEHIRYLVFDAVGRLLNYDFLIIALTGRIYHLLESLLVPHYGAETATVVAKLNSGLPGNATMITNMRIWDLAQEARKSPWISDLLCTNEPEEFMTRLQENSAGRKFAEKLNAFLQEFGHREIRLDIIYPTWIEDPTPLLGFLRSYMDADDDQNPYKQHESLALAREALTQETLSRMQQGMKGRLLLAPFFRWILRQAQINTRERDTMHFEWTRLFSPARRMLRELGRRWLEKGWLNQVEDIYFVSFAEMEEMVHTPDDLREVVLERREVYAADCNRSWPDIIRDGQELFLSWNQPQDSLDGGLGGVAGSPGVVTGRCRIIKGPEDFGLLNKGEILVAPLTNPVWTPLFAIAGGVITEVGGILSHGAIVAREYGIPAVMAVPQATQILQDGQMISIDGNKGQVFILQEADS